MLPEDDYLRLKPAAQEHRMVLRIALMALMGCLALLAALVVQAPAATGTAHQAIIKASQAAANKTHPAVTLGAPGSAIVTPGEQPR
jgi:hypothetical protein